MKLATIVLGLFGVLMMGSLGARADSGNPFGFETNTHPLKYEYCKKEPGLFRNHGYKCSSAPRPHPDLEEYMLKFVEQVGLCFILATNDPDRWYTRAGIPEGDSYGFVNIDYPLKSYLDTQWKSHLQAQISNFLEDIGLEQNRENADQLIRVLETYIGRSPGYGKRFQSQDTKLLQDAFNEMKKKWFVAGQSNPLLEWERNLKKIIEKEIRSDRRNKFETFKRQIIEKYGPSTTPQNVEHTDQVRSSSGITSDTRNEILHGYRNGYEWSPKEGFDGLWEIEQILLKLFSANSEDWVAIYFWLATSDDCREKIDEKGDQAF